MVGRLRLVVWVWFFRCLLCLVGWVAGFVGVCCVVRRLWCLGGGCFVAWVCGFVDLGWVMVVTVLGVWFVVPRSVCVAFASLG